MQTIETMQMSNTRGTSISMKALVCCQGTIQLASALAAIKQEYADDAYSDKFLFISDLCVFKDDEVPFFECIKNMATGTGTWSGVHYLESECIPFEKSPKQDFTRFCSKVYALIGTNHIDVLYVSTDSHRSNLALISAFPHSRVVCYGDGPGIFIPNSYQYLTRASNRSRFQNLLMAPLKTVLGSIGKMLKTQTYQPALSYSSACKIERGLFLIPDAYGLSPQFPFEKVSKETFLQTLISMANVLDGSEVKGLAKFMEYDNLCVLLSSNFSEALRMTVDNEIEAYNEFLNLHSLLPIDNLVIKPHPRDSEEKLAKMKSYFRSRVSNVLMLDQGQAKYLPLELLLIRAREGDVDFTKIGINFYTFSTALLSFSYLLGANVHLGFGEKIVEKYLFPSQVNMRIQHEADLNKSADRLLRSKTKKPYK